MNTPPSVSISCITYNQKDFIEETIEGFLKQKTTFPIEAIIHDDASTDGTKKIVEKYMDKYPELIKPIFQDENQYSKYSGNIGARFVWPHARGKYIALCEGDDYWTDPYKLQKQVDELEKHPECYICFHPVQAFDDNRKKSNKIIGNHGKSNRRFDSREVILGGGGFMPTPSVVVNRRVIETLPDWFFEAPASDYFLQILGSLNGGALYLNETMAVYRTNVKGSWTDRIKNPDYRLEFYTRQLATLKLADSYTKKYSYEFKIVRRSFFQKILIDRFIDLKARKEIYLDAAGYLSRKEKILWNLIYKNTILANSLAFIKKIVLFSFTSEK